MNKNYETLNGETLISSNSWLWWESNKQKDEDQNILFIELFKIDSMEGSLDILLENIKNWQDDYPGYDRLLVEKISLRGRFGGDCDEKLYLVGQRLESVEERDARLLRDKVRLEHAEAERVAKEESKKIKEYEKFLKLKAQFEGDENES